jgi:hypothetical protein
MSTKTWTTIAILVMTLLGLVSGVYLGTHYRPRRPGSLLGRRPARSRPTPIATRPPASPDQSQERGNSKPQVLTSPSRPIPSVAKPSLVAKGVHSPRPAQKKMARQRDHGKTRMATRPTGAPPSFPAPPHRLASRPKPLRVVGRMRSTRPLPVPRRVRQQRLARHLAARRPRLARITTRPRRWREIGLRPYGARPSLSEPELSPTMVSLSKVDRRGAGLIRSRPLSPAERHRALRRAAQTVRYVEREVVLDGRPAHLRTYVAWERGKPRTFSFVRQDRRTDLAKIIRVDEAARQVTVFVPSRGVVIRVTVPVEAMVAYDRALRMDPPAPELVARADSLFQPGIAGPPVPAEVAAAPPVERVAGMREQLPELVGQVRRVDPASRLLVLAGPREKTPFRVAEGVPLPAVGQIVSIGTTLDATVSPRPAMAITLLQPTVAGVVTRVQPLAVELSVRTVTPEGRIAEVPVPVSGDALVFISGRPGDLRALQQGVYIRAFMTPTGETRILGPPSEAGRVGAGRSGGNRNHAKIASVSSPGVHRWTPSRERGRLGKRLLRVNRARRVLAAER